MNEILDATEKNEIVEELAETISAWSLSSARTMLAEMYEVLFEKGITPEQDYEIHMEMLTFFLLSFERYVVGAGGENLLDRLLNETVNTSLRLVLYEMDGKTGDISDDGVKRALDYYNKAARDYDCCQVLVEKTPDYEGKKTVLGKLSKRIAQILEVPNIAEFGDIVSVVAAEALAESSLKAQVETVAVRAD